MKYRLPLLLSFSLFIACTAPPKRMAPSPLKRAALLHPQYRNTVKAYETGKYKEAIEQLDTFLKDKTLHSYQNSYYKGLIHYSLNRFKEAIPPFKAFIRNSPYPQKTINARINLLICYKALQQWTPMTTLALETQRLPLSHDNKILIKLIWAEALIKSRQQAGVRHLLEETKALIAQSSPNSRNTKNLRGRLLWLEGDHALQQCHHIQPPIAIERTLQAEKINYWLAKKSECLRDALKIAMPIFLKLSPQWNFTLSNSIEKSIQNYFDIPRRLTKFEIVKSASEAHKLTHSEMRQHFYKVLDYFAEIESKSPTAAQIYSLRRLNTLIEQLLQKISTLSSSIDRTL